MMSIRIVPYTASDSKAVKAFNLRLEKEKIDFQFSEYPVSSWLPKGNGHTLFEEYFLAKEEDTVRGAYILKRQRFKIKDEVKEVGFIYLPLSEGIVESKYNLVGAQLINDALRRSGELYALGMGGFNNPLPQVLKAMGWHLSAVPFFFHICHPAKFCHNISFLRKSKTRRRLLELITYSGMAWFIVKSGNVILGRKPGKHVKSEWVDSFGSWADRIWLKGKAGCAFGAIREAQILNRLYPCSEEKFLRLKVLRSNEVIGWAVMLRTTMKEHKQFGSMHLGSVVDCMAIPGYEADVVASALSRLKNSGVDLIISNQSHIKWRQAFRATGFLPGPSNFIFAASKRLVKMLSPFEQNLHRMHLTRGDGEGPTHL
jgi:hypothetical protein